jgi:hypothetical protein
MALNIKNEETERLARELSRRRDQGITEEIVDDMKRLPLLEPGGTHRIDLDDDLFD